jgi:hypothetical protein
MVDKNKDEDQECACGCKDGEECECGEQGWPVLELEDENGETVEFVKLDELDFEGRHFVIVAPLSEVQALDESEDGPYEIDLSIEIFEDDGDTLTFLEDEDLAKRLMRHLDKLSKEHDGDDED